MYNAIIPDHLLHATGLFKERLSQSALHAAMQPGARCRGEAALRLAGPTRHAVRPRAIDEATELTERQVLEGLRMYDAAVRLAA